MKPDRIVQGIRVVALVCIGVMVVWAMTQINSAGLKAPLLTMMGSAAIIIALFSVNTAVTMQNAGTIFGTAIVMGGGGYWLTDARQNSSIEDMALSSDLSILLVTFLQMYILLSILIHVGSIIMPRIRRK